MHAGEKDVPIPSVSCVINNFGSMNNIQTADNGNFGTNHGEIIQRSINQRGMTDTSVHACGSRPKTEVQFGVLSLWSLLRTSFPLGNPRKQQEDHPQAEATAGSGSTTELTTPKAEISDMEMISIDEDLPLSGKPILHEVYVRTLLCKGHGLPCWETSPDKPEIQPKGVVPGDVGTYTAKSGFKKIFNLWDDDIVVQRRSKRWNKASTCQIPDRDIEIRSGVLQKGEALFEGVRVSQGSALEDVEYSFTCRFAPGAILALTSSADEEESERLTEVEWYIRHHAKAIYAHASSLRPLGRNESLYIITGCTKSDSWAMAVYTECEPGRSTLQLAREHAREGGGPSGYKWSSQELGSSRLRRSTRGPHPGTKNHTLFLQGFKIAFSQDFRSRMDEDDSGDEDLESTDRGEDEDNSDENDESHIVGGPHKPDGPDPAHDADQPDDPDRARDCDNADNPSGFIDELEDSLLQFDAASHTRNIRDGPSESMDLSLRSLRITEIEDEENIHISPFPNTSQAPYHPSDVINSHLLRQTGCDIAITHDNSWRFFLECLNMPGDQGQDMQKRMDDAGERAFVVRNGVAFLLHTDRAVGHTIPDAAQFDGPAVASASAGSEDGQAKPSEQKMRETPGSETSQNKWESPHQGYEIQVVGCYRPALALAALTEGYQHHHISGSDSPTTQSPWSSDDDESDDGYGLAPASLRDQSPNTDLDRFPSIRNAYSSGSPSPCSSPDDHSPQLWDNASYATSVTSFSLGQEPQLPEHLLEYDISLDPTSVYLPEGLKHDLKYVLSSSAAIPPVTLVEFRHPKLEGSMFIGPFDKDSEIPITIFEVISGLYGNFRKHVTRQEFEALPPARQARVTGAFKRRLLSVGKKTLSEYESELRKGLKRIDLLEGETIFKGFETVIEKSGSYWKLVTGKREAA